MVYPSCSRQIVVMEPLVIGLEHVPVNSALIASLAQTFPDWKIHIFAEGSHLSLLTANMVASDISASRVKVPGRHASFWKRIIRDLINIRLCMRQAYGTGSAPIIVLSGSESIIFAIKLIASVRWPWRPKQTVVCFLHSVLAQVSGWRSRNPFRRMTDIRNALVRFGNANLKYCVLEESIKQVVERYLPTVASHVHVVPHPVVEDEISSSPRMAPHPPFQFAFIGTATAAKGFQPFMEMAKVISQRHPGLAEFHSIGRLHPDLSLPDLGVLKTKPQIERIDRCAYLALVRKVDFVVIPLGSEYELTASGALLDAIAAARPLLISDSPLARNLWREFGDLGLIVAEGQLVHAVERVLLDFNTDTYCSYVRNLGILASSRTPAGLGKYFKEILGSALEKR